MIALRFSLYGLIISSFITYDQLIARFRCTNKDSESREKIDPTNRLDQSTRLNRVLDEYILGVKIEAGFSWPKRKADTSLDYLADRNIARDY